MRRVVVTGVGVVSPIGNNKKEVVHALRGSLSGIEFIPEMKDLGYHCQVAGFIKNLYIHGLRKRQLRTMSDVAKFAAMAAQEALDDAKIETDALQHTRSGIVLGSGVGGISEVSRIETCLRSHKSPTHLGAAGIVKMMNSTAAINLAAWLGVRGRCYSVSSACATGTDSIGHGFELIQHDLLDICVCGASEEKAIKNICAFGDAVLATSAGFNDRPDKACRPYDQSRQGTVISEGSGVLVLEALEHAERREAEIYAEIISYGSANDGAGMFEPNGKGLGRCIEQALASVKPAQIDYINAHGAGTRIGDQVEIQVIRKVFGNTSPMISSTKGLTGHAAGAAGAHEAIYTLLMLRDGFVAPTANLEHVAPECDGVNHVRYLTEARLKTAMSFNSGLGGHNACLIFQAF
jgi:3-oxoacyl-[acyl-carrier-protein] synthase I